MKKCGKCHRILPLSDFWFRKEDVYYQSYCKKCNTISSKKYSKKTSYRKKKKDVNEEKSNFILGGYKIYILNYCYNNEFRYNIVSTKGDVFKTCSPSEFLEKIKEVLYGYSKKNYGEQE